MSTLPITDWMDVIAIEYLSDFIRDGGGSVKFAVLEEAKKPRMEELLKSVSKEKSYLFVSMEATTVRVHMPQDMFFALACQIDWRLSARRLLLTLLSRDNYSIEGIDPGETESVVRAVAEANGLEPGFLIAGLRPKIANEVFKNSRMARAFRVAMTHLCDTEAQGAVRGPYPAQPLLDWLTGADTRVGNVRPFQIQTPINRTTARYFLESALYWVRRVGYAGTVVLLDNTRLALAKNPKDGKRFYTRAMTMDHYELLRELIDDMDRLTGMLLVVSTDREFVDPAAPRGWRLYPALQTRVMDEVRDREAINPSAALVRLS